MIELEYYSRFFFKYLVLFISHTYSFNIKIKSLIFFKNNCDDVSTSNFLRQLTTFNSISTNIFILESSLECGKILQKRDWYLSLRVLHYYFFICFSTRTKFRNEFYESIFFPSLFVFYPVI